MARIPRQNPNRVQRVDKRKEIHRQMWGSGSFSVLSHFDHAKTYRVRLTKAVTPAGHSQPLRPMQDIQISGAVADEIKQFISGAALVG
jgi:hypothetical protein